MPALSVIIIDNQARIDCTVWGGILTHAARAKTISGTIVNGAVRDVDQVQELDYPLFCIDHFMRSGKNRIYKSGEQCPLTISGVTIYPGDFIFADDHGVIIIPKHLLDEVIHKAFNIEQTEKKIIAAVHAGDRLDTARKRYHYAEPWLDCDKAEVLSDNA